MPRTARFSRMVPPLRTNWTPSMAWTVRGLRTQESGHFNARAPRGNFYRGFAHWRPAFQKISGIPPYIAAPALSSPQGGPLPRAERPCPGASAPAPGPYPLPRVEPPPRPYKVRGRLEPFDRAVRGPGCFTKQNVRKGVDGCPQRAQGRLVPSNQPRGQESHYEARHIRRSRPHHSWSRC